MVLSGYQSSVRLQMGPLENRLLSGSSVAGWERHQDVPVGLNVTVQKVDWGLEGKERKGRGQLGKHGFGQHYRDGCS